jgi:hypothetical protein
MADEWRPGRTPARATAVEVGITEKELKARALITETRHHRTGNWMMDRRNENEVMIRVPNPRNR